MESNNENVKGRRTIPMQLPPVNTVLAKSLPFWRDCLLQDLRQVRSSPASSEARAEREEAVLDEFASVVENCTVIWFECRLRELGTNLPEPLFHRLFAERPYAALLNSMREARERRAGRATPPLDEQP